MRNMSFMLTTEQFVDGTKDVTRRNGWLFLKVGELVQGVEKSQGLGKGGKIKKLGVIRITGLRREKLRAITNDRKYGRRECVREGFPPPHPKSDPKVFVEFFCRSHKGVKPSKVITRIEFKHVVDAGPAP